MDRPKHPSYQRLFSIRSGELHKVSPDFVDASPRRKRSLDSVGPYARKSRRKTRTDRFDPKPPKKKLAQPKPKKKVPDRVPQSHTKSRKHEPDGVDHTRQPICEERITPDFGSGLGLFRKGRASLPLVRRPGNQDLTFKETDFLSPQEEAVVKRRNIGSTPKRSVDRAPRPACHEEIGSYFQRVSRANGVSRNAGRSSGIPCEPRKQLRPPRMGRSPTSKSATSDDCPAGKSKYGSCMPFIRTEGPQSFCTTDWGAKNDGHASDASGSHGCRVSLSVRTPERLERSHDPEIRPEVEDVACKPTRTLQKSRNMRENENSGIKGSSCVAILDYQYFDSKSGSCDVYQASSGGCERSAPIHRTLDNHYTSPVTSREESEPHPRISRELQKESELLDQAIVEGIDTRGAQVANQAPRSDPGLQSSSADDIQADWDLVGKYLEAFRQADQLGPPESSIPKRDDGAVIEFPQSDSIWNFLCKEAGSVHLVDDHPGLSQNNRHEFDGRRSASAECKSRIVPPVVMATSLQLNEWGQSVASPLMRSGLQYHQFEGRRDWKASYMNGYDDLFGGIHEESVVPLSMLFEGTKNSDEHTQSPSSWNIIDPWTGEVVAPSDDTGGIDAGIYRQDTVSPGTDEPYADSAVEETRLFGDVDGRQALLMYDKPAYSGRLWDEVQTSVQSDMKTLGQSVHLGGANQPLFRSNELDSPVSGQVWRPHRLY
ncbi:MAG: hypothetical protein M1814_001494 [Vezdaea aestivalis]|nr:MAG: hypothetical protein M1814_001494 [Vezdaea aestivalis]